MQRRRPAQRRPSVSSLRAVVDDDDLDARLRRMLGQRAQAGQGVRELVVDRDHDAGARRERGRAARRRARTAPARACTGQALAPAARRLELLQHALPGGLPAAGAQAGHAAPDQAVRAVRSGTAHRPRTVMPIRLIAMLEELPHCCAGRRRCAGCAPAGCARLAAHAGRSPCRYAPCRGSDRLRRRRTTREDSDAPAWRRRLVTWALAAIGLGLGFLIPYTLYLNHQVSERFGQLQLADPDPRLCAPAAAAPGPGDGCAAR